MRILTKKQEKKEEAKRKDVMIRKLKFMGRICSEHVARTGTVDLDQITQSAEAIALVDDVVAGF